MSKIPVLISVKGDEIVKEVSIVEIKPKIFLASILTEQKYVYYNFCSGGGQRGSFTGITLRTSEEFTDGNLTEIEIYFPNQKHSHHIRLDTANPYCIDVVYIEIAEYGKLKEKTNLAKTREDK